MRVQWFAALAMGALTTGALAAVPGDSREQRQLFLTELLTSEPIADVMNDRAACASGAKALSIPRSRSLGANSLPDVADYCVTVLIRLARERRLMPVRDTSASGVTPAMALDTGFAAGFSRTSPMSALPTMATLKPVAERCFAQQEPNVRLCYATGLAFGYRAARGEVGRVI